MIGLRAALGFLTVIPAAAPLTARSVSWMAPVGALVGGAVGVLWWGAAEVSSVLVAAALAVAVDAVLTGGLHYDGLADSADGLLAHGREHDRLRIMREPTVGAFAVVVVAVGVILRWSALAAIEPAWLTLLPLWATARGLAAVALVRLPNARGTGIAAAMQGATFTVPVLLVLVWVPVGVVVDGLAGGVAVMTSWVVAALAIGLGVRRLGGITGDVLGAAIFLAETSGLVVLSASW